MEGLLRNTWLEVDLDQLAHNVAALGARVGPGVRLAPVIKADAYGCGAVAIGRELERMGVAYLAVALLTEALELREHGITAPVLVMGHTPDNLLAHAVRNDITVAICGLQQARILSREAMARHTKARAHIKVDTGFHRLGKEPTPGYAYEIRRMSAFPGLCLTGIFTHLRLADDEGDLRQFALFSGFVRTLDDAGLTFEHCHVSDSIAALQYPEFAMDMIRPGAIIYGLLPRYQAGLIDVRPIMTFKTTVTRVQRVAPGDGVGYDEVFRAGESTVVATLGAGYADGYPRHLSRKGEVLIRGQRARVIGIVCMDQMMVDVSGIEGVRAGDEAVLFGAGDAAPTVEEVAAHAGTNKNDIISGISRRVPRVYIRNGAVCGIVDHLMRGGN